jgi:ubiquinone/menaquinone biosynthesis C-methylase UbiE
MFLHPHKVIPHFNIAEGMKVADMGSGHGHFSLPLAKRVGPSGRVYAIDLISEALDQLRSEASNQGISHIHFIHGNIEKDRGSMLANNSVNRVLLINTLFMLDNKEQAIKEALRILEPKGQMIIVDWHDSFNHLGPHPNNVITQRQAIELAESLGFVVKKEFDAGSFHYGIIFH